MKYYALNEYLQDTFGRKVYKIAIDGGFTCPNRDGLVGNAGCIFCSEGGSGEFAQSRFLSVSEQIEKGKDLLSQKLAGIPKEDRRYIAYFQAFTNTYGPLPRLRSIFTEAIMRPEIAAISIATRPDCLQDEVIELLCELNRIKPVWVELGLQTIHEETAAYIRRGYELSVFDDAMKRLSGKVSHIVVHVILGLPGENEDMMKASVRYVAESGAGGIKLQLLHVLKGTDLAKDYEAGLFETLSMERYVKIVADCIELLPKNMVVHRITGDGDKKLLIAPIWSGDKKRVLNALKAEIESR